MKSFSCYLIVCYNKDSSFYNTAQVFSSIFINYFTFLEFSCVFRWFVVLLRKRYFLTKTFYSMTKLTKSNHILDQAAQLRNEGRAELVNLETFTKALNKKPAVVKANKFQNNAQYVPISHIQTLLDQMFFGLWQTKNFEYKVIGNEICGSVELYVYHPIVKDWIVRTGAAATQIRQNKGAKNTDVDAKIKNALEMDVPHLYADCVKSAAKTLGAAFGRDLNRDHTDNYKAIVSSHVHSQAYNTGEVREKVAKIDNITDLNTYYKSNQYWGNDAEVVSIFDERKRDIQDGL